jgi:hypothetical protein
MEDKKQETEQDRQDIETISIRFETIDASIISNQYQEGETDEENSNGFQQFLNLTKGDLKRAIGCGG